MLRQPCSDALQRLMGVTFHLLAWRQQSMAEDSAGERRMKDTQHVPVTYNSFLHATATEPGLLCLSIRHLAPI
jgi:hypothetical protein